MGDIPKDTNLYDMRTMVFGSVFMALGSSVIPSQVLDTFIDGYWKNHVVETATNSCRAEFGYVSDQIIFPVSKDIVISADSLNNCFEQKVTKLETTREMSNKDYLSLAGAIFFAGVGFWGVVSGANSIRKRRQHNKALKPS